jgi:hypothetical protein
VCSACAFRWGSPYLFTATVLLELFVGIAFVVCSLGLVIVKGEQRAVIGAKVLVELGILLT